jgi:hypothetical protein
LNTEAGKVGNLPSLASEFGVSSFYSSFRFHKGLVSVHFVEFLVVFFFQFDSQNPFEVSANDSTAGTAATHHVLAHLLKNPWHLLLGV